MAAAKEYVPVSRLLLRGAGIFLGGGVVVMIRRVVVTGSREWPDSFEPQLWSLLDKHVPAEVSLLGVGCARGVDKITRDWCETCLDPDQFDVFEANWEKYGRAAGPKRNRLMVDSIQPDLVLAFFVPGEECGGTWDCVEYAQDQGAVIKPFRLRAWE